MDTAQKIETICDNLKILLQEKNKRYGDSALDPLGVFANNPRMANPDIDSAEKGILTRIDDKLGRIRNSGASLRENDVIDLMGYLVLLCAKKGWDEFRGMID